ncbi:MAG TPA: type II secretion system protein N, partial [Burkholderiaceae bacterium]
WQLRPAWLGLRGSVAADCCTPQPLPWQALLAAGGARLALGDATSHWPAEPLAGLGTPWNTVQPQGRLTLATEGLAAQWNQGRLTLTGHARLDALRVSSRLSTLQPMGSYQLDLEGGTTPTLRLQTLDGSSLLLTGAGQWVGQRLRFTGEASAAPGREAALANLLNIIGRRSGARSLISIG